MGIAMAACLGPGVVVDPQFAAPSRRHPVAGFGRAAGRLETALSTTPPRMVTFDEAGVSEKLGRSSMPEPNDRVASTPGSGAGPGLRPLHVDGIDQAMADEARARQAQLTKPAGSLGQLEDVSVRLAGIRRTLRPPLRDRAVFVLAADHGVTDDGVSAYPREVTAQMVLNFLRGGAAINVLARMVGARVVVADLGVDGDLPSHPDLRDRKVRRGTASIARGPAMSRAEAIAAVEAGRGLVAEEHARGLDVACTGDMGIGNTTPSAALICHFTGMPPEQVVGRGTGVDDAGLERKRAVVARALEVNHAALAGGDPLDVLAAIGGLEIAGLVGVALECAARRVPVIIDGFISGAAALTATAIEPRAREYMLAGHRSHELGHAAALAGLDLRPLLDLDMRLGEGTGAVLALPLLEAAVALLDEMATFDSASVSRELG
jgi:nicotinate-nucleotide--dimethylbenzimidazole phosphoribosyltransferase